MQLSYSGTIHKKSRQSAGIEKGGEVSSGFEPLYELLQSSA
jgi:hypothetical protein